MAHVGGRYADIKYAHHPMETAVEVHSPGARSSGSCATPREITASASSPTRTGTRGGRAPVIRAPRSSASYGGLTCFLAARLDRDAIFESMRRRRHYAPPATVRWFDLAATTASDAEVFLRDPAAGPTSSETQGDADGDIARVRDGKVALAIEVVGSAPIRAHRHLRRARLNETVRPYAEADLGARVRWLRGPNTAAGPHHDLGRDAGVEGNRIVRTAVINTGTSIAAPAQHQWPRLEGRDDRQLRAHRIWLPGAAPAVGQTP